MAAVAWSYPNGFLENTMQRNLSLNSIQMKMKLLYVNNKAELDKVQKEIENGWNLTNMFQTNKFIVCVMQKDGETNSNLHR